MAGTAAEQAVGLAKPVLQLPGQGPQFTASFAEAQRRLLGPTVFCAPGDSGSQDNLFSLCTTGPEAAEANPSRPRLPKAVPHRSTAQVGQQRRWSENGFSHWRPLPINSTMTAGTEPTWKRWLDRLLMLNVLVVILGAGFFVAAVVAQSQGQSGPMDLFQRLWQPLFTPAISLLIMAAVLSGIVSWWQRRGLKQGSGSGS
jgi:hypothetical protein